MNGNCNESVRPIKIKICKYMYMLSVCYYQVTRYLITYQPYFINTMSTVYSSNCYSWPSNQVGSVAYKDFFKVHKLTRNIFSAHWALIRPLPALSSYDLPVFFNIYLHGRLLWWETTWAHVPDRMFARRARVAFYLSFVPDQKWE